MNKRGFAKNLIFLFLLICFWIFPHLYLSTEIDFMKRKERDLQIELKAKNDKIERIVEQELKPLMSEDRIVKIARDSLGLVRSLKPFEQIKINGERIKQIKSIVDKKYE